MSSSELKSTSKIIPPKFNFGLPLELASLLESAAKLIIVHDFFDHFGDFAVFLELTGGLAKLLLLTSKVADVIWRPLSIAWIN
ncbi:hypothetical protein QYF36_005114 [Acer negundo]|nr:hypothetical protein QYF36_005114 [Acer negundo]